MPFKTPKSRRVGRAHLDGGGTAIAYQALIEHTCGQCHQSIVPGALFSRGTVRFSGAGLSPLRQAPVCMACRPLHMDGVQEEGSPRWS